MLKIYDKNYGGKVFISKETAPACKMPGPFSFLPEPGVRREGVGAAGRNPGGIREGAWDCSGRLGVGNYI